MMSLKILEMKQSFFFKCVPKLDRLSENNSDIPASKALRLKEELFKGFYLGVFER